MLTTPMTRDEIERAVTVCPQCEGEGSYADGLDEAACTTDCTRCRTNGWIIDLRALEAAGCQIVQGEPEYWHYQRGPTEGRIRIYRDPHLVDAGWTETPLYAGKVQP